MKPSNYNKIHKWLEFYFDKKNKCEFCGKTDKKRYEWALLKDKQYEKVKENFIELCVACHRKYDDGIKNATIAKYKPVVAIKDNKRYLFNSITEASIEFGILRSSIGNALHGRTLTSGGYQWIYV